MEDFDTLMKQAVSIKTGQMLSKRRKFEVQPLFIKAGLYYLIKFANVRRQGFYQRYAVSDHLKGRGNKLFKEEKVEEAAREYEQALSIFRYIVNKNPNWKNEGIIDDDLEYINYNGEEEEELAQANSIKVAIYNNLAACYLNLKEYSNAKAACDETLLLDPNQTKALYRRARAITSDINAGVEEYKAAIEDLKRALEIAPEDAVITQALNKAKAELGKIKNSSQAFKGMFNKKTSEEGNQQVKKEEVKKEVQPLTERKVEGTEKSVSSVNQGTVEVKRDMAVKEEKEKQEESVKKKEKDMEEKKVGNKVEETSKKENKTSLEKQENNMNKNTEVKKTGDKSPNDASPNTVKKEKGETPKPKEIAELERLLEKRGNELLRLYESSGRKQQALELRENLRKAMAAKQRLEKMASLDFEQPNEQLREDADKFGLDLNDPDIKEELRRIQTQNLEDIKNWINGLSPEDNKISPPLKQETKEKGAKPMKPKVKPEDNSNTTNNYYINNNYYSNSNNGNGEPVSKAKLVENIKEQHNENKRNAENNKLLNDLVENVNNLNETVSNSKQARIMNLVIAAIAIGLFLLSLYMQTRKTPVGRQDIAKDI